MEVLDIVKGMHDVEDVVDPGKVRIILRVQLVFEVENVLLDYIVEALLAKNPLSIVDPGQLLRRIAQLLQEVAGSGERTRHRVLEEAASPHHLPHFRVVVEVLEATEIVKRDLLLVL